MKYYNGEQIIDYIVAKRKEQGSLSMDSDIVRDLRSMNLSDFYAYMYDLRIKEKNQNRKMICLI